MTIFVDMAKNVIKAIASGLVETALAILLVCGVAVLSTAIKPVMPEISIKGLTLSYGGISWRYCYVTLTAMPAALAIGTVLRNRPALKTGFAIALMYAYISSWLFVKISGRTIPFAYELNVLLLVVSVLGSWFMIRRHCLRGSLVGAKG